MIKNLGKKLPEPIKKLLIWVYDKWNSKTILDKNMVKDLAEYFDLTYKETICMLKVGTKLNKVFWSILDPKTEKEIERFYELNPFYAFSLSYWHMSIGQRNFRHEIIKICEGDVLDYGGGIGDLCIELAKKGLNVTYADVNGKIFKFAEWLFKKRAKRCEIRVLDEGMNLDEIWAKEYGTIVCIDVIEHIVHPEVVLEKMAKHLKNNGKLIITGLNCIGETEDHPMHLKMNFDAEELLNSFRVFKTEKDWLWIKS